MFEDLVTDLILSFCTLFWQRDTRIIKT